MRSFVFNGKKYIAIIGENKKHKGVEWIQDMPDDIKARYGAVLEWYKTITNHIYNTYLPQKPPYEIKYPKALIYEHTKDKDFVVIEWIENLVSFEDINFWKEKIPGEHAKPINTFLDDWDSAISELSRQCGIRKFSKSKSRYRQFIVKMPYWDVVLNDDFWLRFNDNWAEEELLKNGWYIPGRKGDKKPICYLTDTLIASSILLP
jgi:hypothetical protein